MSPQPWDNAILFAHVETEWSNAVILELAEELGPNNIVITDDGTDLLDALSDPKFHPRLVVAGPPLRTIGALEAIYQTSRKRSDQPSIPIGMITDARSDVEYLDLLNRRGVNLFLFYNDPVSETVARIVRACFTGHRSHERYDCNINGNLQVGEASARVVLRNISEGGGLVSVHPGDANKIPASIGLSGTLVCDLDGEEVSATVEVRRVFAQKRFFRSTVSLGLQFSPQGFKQTKQVDDFLKEILDRLDVFQSTKMPGGH